MPAPSNANSLSLGRPVIDPSTIDTIEDVRENFAKIQEHFVGAGFPCGAQDGDTEYLAVYAQPDGGGEYLLWGGNPTDPLNPTLLTLSLAGTATVVWQDEGSTVISSGTVTFDGAGVTVTDDGVKAIVTIPGGSGTPYTEGNGIDIDGSNVVSAELSTGGGLEFDGSGIAVSVDGTTIDVVGGNLSVIAYNFGTIAVSGQSNVVADAVSDTLTLVAGSNVTITTNAGSDSITIAAAVDGVGYDEIQEEGTPLTKRAKLNFISQRVTAADNAGSTRTDVTFEYYVRVFGTTTTAITAATTTFDVDGVAVIEGDMPELTGGELEITNAAKIPITDETEAEFRWNERDSRWETEPLKCHMVLGLATAAVTGAAFTIDNIELVCGSDPRTDPTDATETLSVENPFGWDIDNNGQVLAVKKANGDWIAKQAECP